MSIIELRENIHRFVDKADHRVLEAIYAIIEEEENTIPSAPEWFYEELNQRRTRHRNGQSKSYSWEQIKEGLNDL